MKTEVRRKSAKKAAKKVAKQIIKARKKMLKETRKKQAALRKSQKKAMKNRLKNSSKKKVKECEKSDTVTSDVSTDKEQTTVTEVGEMEVNETCSNDLRISGDEISAESESDVNPTKKLGSLCCEKQSENGKVNSHDSIQFDMEPDDLSAKKNKKKWKSKEDKMSRMISEAKGQRGEQNVGVHGYAADETELRSSATDQISGEQDNPKNKKSKKNKKKKPKNSEVEDSASAPSVKRGWKNPFRKTKNETPKVAARSSSVASRMSLSSSSLFSGSESTKDKPTILARSTTEADETDSEVMALDSVKPAKSRLRANRPRKTSPPKKSTILHLPTTFLNVSKDDKTEGLLQKTRNLPGIDRLEQRIQRTILKKQAFEELNDPSFNMMLFKLAKQVMLDDQLSSKAENKEKQTMARHKGERKSKRSEWLSALELVLKSQDEQPGGKSKSVKHAHQSHHTNQYTNSDERAGVQLKPEIFEEDREPPSDPADFGDSDSTSSSAGDHNHRLQDIRRLCNVIQLVQAPHFPPEKRHRSKKPLKISPPELPTPQVNTCQPDSPECTPFIAYPIEEPQLTTCIPVGFPNNVCLSSDPSANFVSPMAAYSGILFPHVTDPQTVCFPELYYC